MNNGGKNEAPNTSFYGSFHNALTYIGLIGEKRGRNVKNLSYAFQCSI